MEGPGIWIWVRLRTLYAAIGALKEAAMGKHERARKERDSARQVTLRADADEENAGAEELRKSIHEPKDHHDPR